MSDFIKISSMASMRSSISPRVYIRPASRISILYSPGSKCCSFMANPSLQSLSTGKSVRYVKTRDVKAYANLGPAGPLFCSVPSPPDSWKCWIIGALISAVLPFLGSRFGPLLKLKNEVEGAVETMDRIAEVVEKVAEEVEKVAGEVADHLPEGGKLKDAIIFIENVAKETAKDAHIVDEVLDKVEQVEKEVDSFIDQVEATGKNKPDNKT